MLEAVAVLVVRAEMQVIQLGQLLSGLHTPNHHSILVGKLSVEMVDLVNQFLRLVVPIY